MVTGTSATFLCANRPRGHGRYFWPLGVLSRAGAGTFGHVGGVQVAHGGGQGCNRREGSSEAAQKRLGRRLDRRLEEVAEAVGGGYWRLQMPLTLHEGDSGWA